MRKVFKWLGIVILSLVVIVAIAAFVLTMKFSKLTKATFEVNLPKIEAATDSASLARGAVIAASICTSCHGGDFAGMAFFDEPNIASIPAPNITLGGKTKNYSDDDWVRTLRYAVKPDGHGLIIMPSSSLGKMSDADLAALIGYMRTVPPSDKTWPDPQFSFVSKIMAGAGLFGDLYEASIIDLTDNNPKIAPAPSTASEYGAYTASFHGCPACHGASLNGLKSPDPVSPPGSNITSGGNFGKWSLEQFSNTLRSGTTPEGKILDTEFMPWTALGLMTDLEIEAVYNYLKSVPAMEDAEEVTKWEAKN